MITDEMLATAAKELSLAIGATFPDPSKNVHHFSLRFKRKMNQLVKKTNHPVRYLWTQRVAGFILVLFVGFMMIMTVSPTVRASVIGWIRERYESYIVCPPLPRRRPISSPSIPSSPPTAAPLSPFPPRRWI